MVSYHLFSKNGHILPSSDALVPLSNIEYSYGYGVYETLKVRNTIVYFVDQHLDRLEHSAKTLEIELPYTTREIKRFLLDLIEALQLDACNIKILLIGGEQATLYIFASAPLFPDRKLYKHGARLLTYTYERLFPTAKTLNMLPSYLAYKQAKEHNCYDALLIDHNTIMLEGTRTNFCLIKGKTIYHAPEHRILAGVTLLTLARIAKQEGFSITQQNISLNTLLDYEGAFITSTSTKIMPIRQIDSFSFPDISQKIRDLAAAYDIFLAKCEGIFS